MGVEDIVKRRVAEEAELHSEDDGGNNEENTEADETRTERDHQEGALAVLQVVFVLCDLERVGGIHGCPRRTVEVAALVGGCRGWERP